jgi:ubiquinone/menaquinone biosynthesis C-methylase UbiE
MPDVCPWRHAYAFDNWLRRLVLNPEKLFAPYVRRGMTALDIGCGMGVNSIGLARMVGEEGCVIAVDVQEEMLEVMRKRAERAGVAERIRAHRSQPDAIGVEAQVGFAVAFWMVHEVPDIPRFLAEVRSLLAADAHFFVAEPQMHVSGEAFEATLEAARGCGLAVGDRPRVRLSRAAVLRPE